MLIFQCPNINSLTLYSRLKIHYSVEDETGTASVVFWDKQATQILGKTAAEMKQILLSVGFNSYVLLNW